MSAAGAFSYRAIRRDGVHDDGAILAPDRDRALAALHQRGLTVIELGTTPQAGAGAGAASAAGAAGLSLPGVCALPGSRS